MICWKEILFEVLRRFQILVDSFEEILRGKKILENILEIWGRFWTFWRIIEKVLEILRILKILRRILLSLDLILLREV